MIALALLADVVTADVAAPSSPDPAAMRDAVQKCDRDAMGKLNKIEPHRRAEFADAVYAEQLAIAQERAGLDPGPASSAAGRASLEAARGALDARQRRLDDTKLVEKAWRDAVEEMRADYLANCDLRKRN